MIKHLVLWKMKPLAEGRTGKENAEILAQRLNALKAVIPIDASIEAGVNFNEAATAYDVGLHTSFKTKDDLNAYQNHPAHIQVANWTKSGVVESRVVADFEV